MCRTFRLVVRALLLSLLTTQPAWALPGIAAETGTLALPEKFTGKRLDAESGIYDFGAGGYDPGFARWTLPPFLNHLQ